jgi:hypothetical protein
MKKSFLFLVALFLSMQVSLFILPSNTAYADVSYLRVITEDTPFYKNVSDKEPLFFLPYTYYVQVIDSGKDFTHVEIDTHSGAPVIDGFVPTGLLFSDGLSVDKPYLSLSVKTATTALLFEDRELSTPLQYVFAERQMQYYGKYVNSDGFVIYYVNYNNRLGYVKEADIYPFSYQNHPNELTFIKPESPPIETPAPSLPNSDGNNLLVIKILIIACLLFSGIVALIFALRNKKESSSAVTFYDENDYE